MTTHTDRVTNAEDVAFDATMKIAGIIVGLLVIAAVAFWYIYS
jgi:hypothetical protein